MSILNPNDLFPTMCWNDLTPFTVMMLLIFKVKIIWIGGLPAVALESV